MATKTLTGTDFADVLSGDTVSGDNFLIEGYGGGDRLTGGNEADTIYGGDGSDMLYGLGGDDALFGGADNDSLYAGNGGGVSDGGDGNDRLYLIHASAGVTINIDGGTYTGGGSFTGIEIIHGTNHGDTILVGSGGMSGYFGEGGNDLIDARDSVDATINLYGGDGDDTLLANQAVQAFLYGGSGNDDMHGSDLDDQFIGGDDNDTMTGLGGIDIFWGGSGADIIYGGGDNDSIYAGDGDDSLFGGDGNDTIYGGDGADYVDGGDGYDSVWVGNVNRTEGMTIFMDGGASSGGDAEGMVIVNVEEVLGLTEFADTVHGNDAGNYMVAGAGDDALFGGGGDDTLNDHEGNDVMFGGGGNDTFWGGEGDDTLFGGANNDSIAAGFGRDTVYGGGGDDFVSFFPFGADDFSLNGGKGHDILQVLEQNVVYDKKARLLTWEDFQGNPFSARVVGFEEIRTAGQIHLFGTNGDDYVELLPFMNYADSNMRNGSDTGDASDETNGLTASLRSGSISGRSGGDIVIRNLENFFGGSGNDSIEGTSGVNTIAGGGGTNTISMGKGNDFYIGGPGVDSVDGGPDRDTVMYVNSTAGVEMYLDGTAGTAGDATGDRISRVEALAGSLHDDTLHAGSVAATLAGFGGDDTLFGGEKNDFLYGGGGVSLTRSIGVDPSPAEVLNSDGNDLIYGGGGRDRILGDPGTDALYGGAENDSIYADSAEVDYLYEFRKFVQDRPGKTYAVGDDSVYGGDGNDTIYGSHGNNELYGDIGNDVIYGLTGRDKIYGGADNDALYASYFLEIENMGGQRNKLWGGDGRDRLYAGSNLDSLFGGAKADELHGVRGYNVQKGSELSGGGGADTIKSYREADTLFGDGGADTLFGGIGSDTLIGGAGADSLDGGAGQDTADYSDSLFAVTIDLVSKLGFGGDAEGDQLVNIEVVIGTTLQDSLFGSNNDDTLYGGGDGDSLSGGDGNDYLYGGGGRDRIDGGLDDDTIWGGSGNDTFILRAGGGETDIEDADLDDDTIELHGYGVTHQQVRDGLTDGVGGVELRLNAELVLFLKGLSIAQTNLDDIDVVRAVFDLY